MKVILAMDGSETSEAALHAVANRRWPADTVVRVLTVNEPLFPPGEALPAAASASYVPVMASLTAQAEAIASRAAERLGAFGLATDWEVLFGDPAREIVLCAKEWGAHLIVMGTHGRHGLRRLLSGSVAEHVVRHACCSVEVVRETVPEALQPSAP